VIQAGHWEGGLHGWRNRIRKICASVLLRRLKVAYRAGRLPHCSISASARWFWVRRFRETGSVAAKPMGGDYRSRLTTERAWLLERIAQEPDLTLEELRDKLKDRGISVGYGTVWRFFAREDITVKKKRTGGRARAA
jgi:transposase